MGISISKETNNDKITWRIQFGKDKDKDKDKDKCQCCKYNNGTKPHCMCCPLKNRNQNIIPNIFENYEKQKNNFIVDNDLIEVWPDNHILQKRVYKNKNSETYYLYSSSHKFKIMSDFEVCSLLTPGGKEKQNQLILDKMHTFIDDNELVYVNGYYWNKSKKTLYKEKDYTSSVMDTEHTQYYQQVLGKKYNEFIKNNKELL